MMNLITNIRIVLNVVVILNYICERSERRSCLYHNFVDDYCIDCGCFKHQVENKKLFTYLCK